MSTIGLDKGKISKYVRWYMFLKSYFDYKNKTIFAYLTIISCLLHIVFIFSSSSLSYFLRSEFDLNDYVSQTSNYVIEIELETEREEEENEEGEEISKEEEKAKEDLSKEKRQLFVDTSDKITDEEPEADTDRIGEKGSIAKDMYTGKDNINNDPRLTGDVKLLANVPDELISAKPQGEGLTMEGREDVQPLVDEKMDYSLSDMDNSEIKSTDSEVSNEMLDESVVQEDTKMEDEKEVIEESKDEIAEVAKEYTEIASIPKNRIIETIEGSKESVSNKVQNDEVLPESQINNNIPYGDDTPFFEDNISNASVQGEGSFNIKKHEYAQYYKHIRDQIRSYWLLQYGTDASINLVTKSYEPIIVEFKVISSGKIVNVVIDNAAGNELLASKMQASVKNTILKVFPNYVDEKYINVKFNFYFF
ncbi:MAG: hypothetical protein ACE5KZ_00355 [Candidatus Scalinduaceae bacterium]